MMWIWLKRRWTINHQKKNIKNKNTNFSNEIVGDAATYGKGLFELLTEKLTKFTEKSDSKKLALIGTGELTVSIKGSGIGGRNQEMLLSFLSNIKDKKIDYKFLVIAVNVDGLEGNSKAMGALVDNYLLTQANNKNTNFEWKNS